MVKIYHNPRCSKSRQALSILEEQNQDIHIIKYLENVPTEQELSELISLLNISPIELVRKNEAIWKEKYKSKELSDQDLIKAMVENPKLIERPIIVKNKKAVIGRPPEKVITIL
ncbi:arsenate reductase (glutaredoxin) [Aquimarina sp. MMG016]|uniref:arsenate reductase (glutaredoxin) n=1 Tax=Aquimarina sp. MMG016 TaxID=2822690 RepID=UPI001B39F3B4|nr:arsenate reductase (glutaredoxin) [Aquimarina sp. MMG016]MBQ4821928.1 arsenate reductase (glutaredoxin) [Aquimarina sp. MMG016]